MWSSGSRGRPTGPSGVPCDVARRVDVPVGDDVGHRSRVSGRVTALQREHRATNTPTRTATGRPPSFLLDGDVEDFHRIDVKALYLLGDLPKQSWQVSCAVLAGIVEREGAARGMTLPLPHHVRWTASSPLLVAAMGVRLGSVEDRHTTPNLAHMRRSSFRYGDGGRSTKSCMYIEVPHAPRQP